MNRSLSLEPRFRVVRPCYTKTLQKPRAASNKLESSPPIEFTQKGHRMRRRQILQSMGSLMAAAALRTESVEPAQAQENASTDVTGRLARYMVEARDRALPPEVVVAAKHRILATLCAIVSGAH